MLRLTQVTKRYGGQTVVDSVDVVFPVATTSVLIGPSGCGKSTLLKMLIGLVAPDEGQVYFADQELQSVDLISMRKRYGYVIQSGGLFPHLTARENICLPFHCHANNGATDNITDRVHALAKLTRFPAPGLDRFPAQLSGGQRQRVSLMRALVLDPDVLLLDEPLGALDPMIRADLQSELAAIFKSLQKTVVLVTHDLHEANIFADQILLMNQGRVVQRGKLAELIHSPADGFVTRFVRAQHVSAAAIVSPQEEIS